jgi:hypothetical protein
LDILKPEKANHGFGLGWPVETKATLMGVNRPHSHDAQILESEQAFNPFPSKR